MVRNVIMDFDIPLKGHDWVQKWCVDVRNINSSKNINGRCPLESSERHTQEISKFRLHFKEPIWYLNKCKGQQNPCKPAI